MPDFCEHCQGQRFDRARVLRALRQLRKALRGQGRRHAGDDPIDLALSVVRSLEIPHLDIDDEGDDQVIH